MTLPFPGYFPDYFKAYGLNCTSLQPVRNASSSTNAAYGARFEYRENAEGMATGFCNFSGIAIDLTSYHGMNTYRPAATVPGEQTIAKYTWLNLSILANHFGAGQRMPVYIEHNAYGMGDTALLAQYQSYWGGNIAGDEGVGWSHVNYLRQTHGSRQLSTITQTLAVGETVAGVGRRSNFHGTLAAAITAGGPNPQTVSVTVTSGTPAVDDWICVEPETSPVWGITEAVRITAVGVGTVSGIFRNNHPSGAKIRPATIICAPFSPQCGQDRVLVNVSATPYTTGTLTGNSGGQINGSGTSWSNTMIGGDAEGLNVGVISIENDRYTGGPFNGADTPGSTTGPLRSWHQIFDVTATTLGIVTNSCAGDASYKGLGLWPSNYRISPGMRILRVGDNVVIPYIWLIGEYSTHAWNVGDVVECAVCPYPDVTGHIWALEHYTPNGPNLRAWTQVWNRGARAFNVALSFIDEMCRVNDTTSYPDVDKYCWERGLYIQGAKTGILIDYARFQTTEVDCAISLRDSQQDGVHSDNMSKIQFGWGGYIVSNQSPSVYGLEIAGGNGAVTGGGGTIHLKHSSLHSSVRATMRYNGGIVSDYFLELGENDASSLLIGSNVARIFAEDNGAGKTRLMAKFGSGAAVQLAIEP